MGLKKIKKTETSAATMIRLASLLEIFFVAMNRILGNAVTKVNSGAGQRAKSGSG
jgi:hypothetical protein